MGKRGAFRGEEDKENLTRSRGDAEGLQEGGARTSVIPGDMIEFMAQADGMPTAHDEFVLEME